MTENERGRGAGVDRPEIRLDATRNRRAAGRETFTVCCSGGGVNRPGTCSKPPRTSGVGIAQGRAEAEIRTGEDISRATIQLP